MRPGAWTSRASARSSATCLGNALEYSLAVSRLIELSAIRDGDRLVVRVVDDGPGIPQQDIASVFEPLDLMNKVTEAKKAAEAALITRREETAAMRSQANTAKILETSPTLMRLRELEVLEKVSQKANLTVVLGEKGLADRVVKLL
jgi:sensor histidine kinase regulating citrate/malate metabolism